MKAKRGLKVIKCEAARTPPPPISYQRKFGVLKCHATAVSTYTEMVLYQTIGTERLVVFLRHRQ